MIRLRWRTEDQAPNGNSSFRRQTIGVGETVQISANERVTWSCTGENAPTVSAAPDRRCRLTFNRHGRYVIHAANGRHRESLAIRVVRPSVRVSLINSAVPQAPEVGVGMFLRFVLTPLEVSFVNIRFREGRARADQIWGYYGQPGRALNHPPTGRWVEVLDNNEVRGIRRLGLGPRITDLAATSLNPMARSNWPMSRGGYRWQIPNFYQVNGVEYELAKMPQTFRIEPSSPVFPYFSGRFTVNKGGVQLSMIYHMNQMVRIESSGRVAA